MERWNEVPFARPLSRVREGVAAAGRGPTEIICRFFCAPGMDVARFLFTFYATVPVYEAFFRALGWGAAIDPMVSARRAGDRKGAVAAVPDELVREIFVFGEPDAMRARLGEYAARGITTLVVTPLGPPDMIEALAP